MTMAGINTLIRRSAVAFSFWVAFAAAAAAAPYFAASSVPPTLIDAPIAPETAEWKWEIEQIIELQKDASPAAVKAAEAERVVAADWMVAPVDANLTRTSNPALFALLDRVGETVHGVSDLAKNHWNTRRPYLMDDQVKALIGAHDNPAYPSGHTAVSHVWADVLGLLLPEEKGRFYARAEEVSQHRVLVGMHYPNDLKGGVQLARLIMGGLLQNAEFQQDLEKARVELTRAK